MSQAEDMKAVNTYMRTKPIPQGNTEAFQIKDAFIRWYDALSWWTRDMDGDSWDNARTRRNQFNIALAATPIAKQEMKEQLARGIETEEMQGKAKPAYDAATGRVGTQVKKPTVQPTPSTMPSSKTPGTVKRAVLNIGSRGPDVDVWQKFVGIIPTTSYYGEVSKGKTKNYQTSKGLPATGIVDEKTWAIAFPGTVSSVPAVEAAFAPSPTPVSSSAFKATPKPAVKAAVKTLPATKTSQVKETVSTKTKAAVAKAGGLFDLDSWPTWAKVLAGAVVVGGLTQNFILNKRDKEANKRLTA
jgi:peptidoglycan hydrolase-like protein with peptidoglycan-binding domain